MPAILGFAGSILAQPILLNDPVATAASEPSGWHARSGATIRTNRTRGTGRVLHGASRGGAIVWEHDRIVLQPQRDYRLEGWVNCSSGGGRLGIELIDDSSLLTGRFETPPVQPSGWRYVAVEFNSANARAGRVMFWVKGEADLDDAVLAPVATSYIGNKGVESDARGRIPFWSEERTDTLLPGRRSGRVQPDVAVTREGKSSAHLTATGDWFGLSSVNYPVAAWTDRMEFSAWAKCGDASSARLLACWTDDSQNVLHVDTGPIVRGTNWQRLALVTESVPDRAMAVRLVAVVQGGRAWFDDFDLLRLRPRQRRVQVFVNQIGYESAGPKSAIIASNFFPEDSDRIDGYLLAKSGRVAKPLRAVCAGRIHGGQVGDWGWYFWRLDFSEFKRPGSYRMSTHVGNVAAESTSFEIGRSLLVNDTAQNAVDFFYVQRCGFDVPGWHKACHLDDAQLPDGTHLDATGGWHSAGDYNKLIYEHGDGGVAFALLSAFDSAPDVFRRFDRDGDGRADALDEANWGAAFVAKMLNPETGGLRNHVHQGPGRNWTKWSAPEVHTDNVSGTGDDPVVQPGEGNSPLVIAAWARLAAPVNNRQYLANAIRLWNHGTKNGEAPGNPYLLIATLELHRVTGQSAYLDYARRTVDHLLSQQVITNGVGQGAFGNYGDTTAAALSQFALAHPREARSQKTKLALKGYIEFCVRTAQNPFGISPNNIGAAPVFFPVDLGSNFQLLSRAWAAALAYRVTRDGRALRYAQDHLDWVLGKNPLNLCMFEGKGVVNPPRYHHRYNSIPAHERGAVPGAIPNGFVQDMGLADRPGFDLSRAGGRAPSYRTSEPWLVHNLFFLLAASALDRAIGD